MYRLFSLTLVFICFQGISYSQQIRPNSIDGRTHIIQGTIDSARLNDNVKVYVGNIISVTDTIALQLISNAVDGQIVYVDSVGLFTHTDSVFIENGVIAVGSVTAAKQWVRDHYLQTSEIFTSWSGAVAGDATNDHTAIQRAANALSAGDHFILDGASGYLLLGSSGVTQLLFDNIDNLTVELRTDVKLADNSVTARTSLFYFDDCDKTRFIGNGHTIDGNHEGQSGYSGGYVGGTNRNAIKWNHTSQTSVSDLYIENVHIKNYSGTAVWAGEPGADAAANGEDVVFYKVSVDSVGEGLLTNKMDKVVFNECTTGRIFAQDGIEPARGNYIIVTNCTFQDTASTSLDVFKCNYVFVHGNKSNTFFNMSIDSDSSRYNSYFNNDFYNCDIGIDMSIAESAPVIGDGRNVTIANNLFHISGGTGIRLVGNRTTTTVDPILTITNNTFIFDSTSSDTNAYAISYKGQLNGVLIKKNSFYNYTKSLLPLNQIAVHNITFNGAKSSLWKLYNNDFYDFNIGIRGGGGSLDSVEIVNNNFHYTHKDSVWHVITTPFLFTSGSSIISGNSGELIFDSDDYTATTTFSPLLGPRTYNITGSITTITTPTTMAYGHEITFIQDSTVTTEFTVSHANNIHLVNGLNWFSAKGETLVLKLDDSGVWYEVSRTGTDRHVYNLIDSNTKIHIVGSAGKITDKSNVDSISGISASAIQFAVNAGSGARDGGDYITFTTADEYLATGATADPVANDITINLLLSYKEPGIVLRDQPAASDQVHLLITTSNKLQLILHDGVNSVNPDYSVAIDSATGRIYHVTIVVDRTGDTVKWYINGELKETDSISSLTGTIDPTGINMRLGSSAGWAGDLYEFRYIIGDSWSSTDVKNDDNHLKMKYGVYK